MNDKLKGWLIFIVMVALAVMFALAMSSYIKQGEDERKDCVEKYSGELKKGYCIYIEDGNSKHVEYRFGKEYVSSGGEE